MKKLLLITTGGTIASVSTDKGLAPGLQAKDILEYISYSKNPEDLEIDKILGKSKGVSHKKIAKLLIEARF